MQVVLNNHNTVILLANQIVLSANHIEQQHERITSRPTIRRRLSNYVAYPICSRYTCKLKLQLI